MAKPTNIPEVPTEEIPEVQAFLEARTRIEDFKKTYPGLYSEFQELADQFNATREAAEKLVRGRKISSGPFFVYQTSTFYDADKLYDAVGRDEFLKMGGKIENLPTYSIDHSKLEAMISQNKLKPEIVEVVREIRPSYKIPTKIVLP